VTHYALFIVNSCDVYKVSGPAYIRLTVIHSRQNADHAAYVCVCTTRRVQLMVKLISGHRRHFSKSLGSQSSSSFPFSALLSFPLLSALPFFSPNLSPYLSYFFLPFFLPSLLSSNPFLFSSVKSRSFQIQLGVCVGALQATPAESGVKPQPKSNLEHFSFKM